jgi:organic hydroperoxide reductase OsmC/OhrA
MAETFRSSLVWSGAAKGATTDPVTFSRDLDVRIGNAILPMSSAPGYRGDASRLNPEQLFVAAVSACHALTFLFLAAKRGVAVIGYSDDAEGQLARREGKLRMSAIVLRPVVTLATTVDEDTARRLMHEAHDGCFIGNSIVTDVAIEPHFAVAVPADAAA